MHITDPTVQRTRSTSSGYKNPDAVTQKKEEEPPILKFHAGMTIDEIDPSDELLTAIFEDIDGKDGDKELTHEEIKQYFETIFVNGSYDGFSAEKAYRIANKKTHFGSQAEFDKALEKYEGFSKEEKDAIKAKNEVNNSRYKSIAAGTYPNANPNYNVFADEKNEKNEKNEKIEKIENNEKNENNFSLSKIIEGVKKLLTNEQEGDIEKEREMDLEKARQKMQDELNKSFNDKKHEAIKQQFILNYMNC